MRDLLKTVMCSQPWMRKGAWHWALLALACVGCTSNDAGTTSQASAKPGGGNVILFLGDGMGVSTVTAALTFHRDRADRATLGNDADRRRRPEGRGRESGLGYDSGLEER